MNSYIKNLQNKPEHIRKQWLFGVLALSMSLVAFVWVYNLTDRWGSGNSVTKKEDTIGPFKLFTKSISDTYENISASVGNVTSPKNKSETNTERQIDLIPVERNPQ